MTTLRRALFATLLALAALAPARAADHAILGTTLTVKDPGAPEKRRITVTAKGPSAATVVGNPIQTGATLTIRVDGATTSQQSFPLPAGLDASGRRFWNVDASGAFTYRDARGENGPVTQVQLKPRNGVFQIKVDVKGALGPVDVVPPNPGTTGCVAIVVGGGDSYSVRFDTGVVTNRDATLFKVAKPTVAGTCVTTTTTTTTTTSTTTTTLGVPYVPPVGPAPLRYRDVVFPTVATQSNGVYGSAVNLSGQTVTLLYDVYQPVGDAVTARPMIIWIHGGSFSSGTKTSPELVDEATVFSKLGYVNASITYRLEPPGCSAGGVTATCVNAIMEALADAQTAVRFFRANAATWGIDPTRIAIAGTSAGAITALNVGFGTSEAPDAGVAAAVALSGAALGSPVTPGDAPSLLFHGTADVVVPYQWAVNTVTSAQAAGLDVFLTSWAGAGHVPYAAHRTEILEQTRNFLYAEMDLANAAQ